MKNINARIAPLLAKGYCTPQIARLAKLLKEPSTTIHYNIKKLEREGKIKDYKAVMDHKALGKGYSTFLLVNLLPQHYSHPEEIARAIAQNPDVESVDIITGDYELLIKLHHNSVDDYYSFITTAAKKYGFAENITLTSLKRVKSEFMPFG